jgi:subtilase family serine protease
MRRRHVIQSAVVGVATAGLVASAFLAGSGAATAASGQHPNYVRSCAHAAKGYAACNALLSTRVHTNGADTTPAGYGPTDLQSAYKLASAAAANGGTQTVALVDAYDDPNAASDLATYRTQYGLSPCTTASGCFAKVPGSGSTLPATDGGWAQEESLDIDMVSAICPNCKIRLVEALSNSNADLATAEHTAANLGATEISNSYGGSETASDPSLASSSYTYPGVLVTASSGDGGYGVEFPAAAPKVIAVGGTSLTTASNSRGWTETVWGHGASSSLLGGAGSGCSKYETKPAWQHDSGCAKRTVADVSADADPNTGVAVYDSTAYRGQSGWLEFGGTSVASPIIASVGALAGNFASLSQYPAGAIIYHQKAHFFDVTSGSNGSCGGSYLCTGKVGYDGPTGLGTPNGIAGF